MAILGCLLSGLAFGVVFGGWSAARCARLQDFDGASRLAKRSALVACVGAMLGSTVFLGWPWRDRNISMAEEVTRTVTKQVDEVVEIPYWYFWKKKQIETRQVPEEITEIKIHTEVVREFSFVMIIPMLFIGAITSLLDLFVLWAAWRRLGLARR